MAATMMPATKMMSMPFMRSPTAVSRKSVDRDPSTALFQTVLEATSLAMSAMLTLVMSGRQRLSVSTLGSQFG